MSPDRPSRSEAVTNDSVVVEYWNGAQWVMAGRCIDRPMFIRSLMETTTRSNPGVSIRATINGHPLDFV